MMVFGLLMRAFFVKTCFFACIAIAVFDVRAQSVRLKSEQRIHSRYRFEADGSLLDLFQRWVTLANYEMTFNGRYELPLIPELRSIEAVTLRDGVEQALSAYRGYDLDVLLLARLDVDKKHLFLSSSSRAETAKLAVSKLNMVGTGFNVLTTDKSLMQVLVRWAVQAGYKPVINKQQVNLAIFPSHPSRFMDYTLIGEVQNFKTASPLKQAVAQLLILYTGRSLAPFNIQVDDASKQLNIVSLVKP